MTELDSRIISSFNRDTLRFFVPTKVLSRTHAGQHQGDSGR